MVTHITLLRGHCSLKSYLSLGSFSNDDGDDIKNVKKAMGLITKTTNLHVHYTFWYISLPSLHDQDVKLPNGTFYGGRNPLTLRRIFLSLSKLGYGLQELNSREFHLHLKIKASWNNREDVW